MKTRILTDNQHGVLGGRHTPNTTPEEAAKMQTLQLVNYSRLFRKYGEEDTEQCKNIEAEIFKRVMGK